MPSQGFFILLSQTGKASAPMAPGLISSAHLIKNKNGSSSTAPSHVIGLTNRRNSVILLKMWPCFSCAEKPETSRLPSLTCAVFSPQTSEGSHITSQKNTNEACYNTCNRSSLSTSVLSALREEKRQFRVTDKSTIPIKPAQLQALTPLLQTQRVPHVTGSPDIPAVPKPTNPLPAAHGITQSQLESGQPECKGM